MSEYIIMGEYSDYWSNIKTIKMLDKWWNTEEKMRRRQPIYELLDTVDVGSVLDHGAGTLKDYLYFKKRGWRYTAADKNRQMIKLSRETHPKVNYIHDDILNSVLPNHHSELIYSNSVICHLPLKTVPLALNEYKRLARRYVLVATPYLCEKTKAQKIDGANDGWFWLNQFRYTDLRRMMESIGEIVGRRFYQDIGAYMVKIK